MPTQTFTVQAADDNDVQAVNTTYPPTTTSYNTGDIRVRAYKGHSTPDYYLINGLFRFDTSSLPDAATVTGATLRVYVYNMVNADSRSLTADWYVWTGSGDYTSTVGTNANAGVALSSISVNATNDLILSAPESNVSLSGLTGVRLHISGGAPSTNGENYVFIASSEHTTLPEAQLLVTYFIEPRLHVGNDIAVDETTSNTAVALNTAPAAGATSYATVIRSDNPDQGQTQCHFYSQAVAYAGSETAVSLTPVRAFVASTAATTHTVTAGKTMRITAINGAVWRSTGTNSATTQLKLQLRVNTSGIATTTSPIAWSGTWAWGELVAASTTVNFGSHAMTFDIPEGIELPSGASFMLTVLDVAASQASRHTNEISMNAYEV